MSAKKVSGLKHFIIVYGTKVTLDPLGGLKPCG